MSKAQQKPLKPIVGRLRETHTGSPLKRLVGRHCEDIDMKLWRIWCIDEGSMVDGRLIEYFSSRRDAARKLREYLASDPERYKEPSGIERIDVPTDRGGLIRFLNMQDACR